MKITIQPSKTDDLPKDYACREYPVTVECPDDANASEVVEVFKRVMIGYGYLEEVVVRAMEGEDLDDGSGPDWGDPGKDIGPADGSSPPQDGQPAIAGFRELGPDEHIRRGDVTLAPVRCNEVGDVASEYIYPIYRKANPYPPQVPKGWVRVYGGEVMNGDYRTRPDGTGWGAVKHLVGVLAENNTHCHFYRKAGK
jgi:hypothetical protein